VKALRRAIARTGVLLRELELKVSPPKVEHEFFIVTAAHDAEQYVRRHLDSVWDQNYPRERFRQCIVDDASTDVTSDLVQLFKNDNPSYQILFSRNDARAGGCANLTRGFREAPRDSIVVQLDGDDWLPDPGVLSYLNLLYQDADLWMTYNSWAFPDGRTALNCHPIAERVVRENAFRDAPWTSSHLHSFRAKLFSYVRNESLVDPETSEFFRSAVDMAHYFPMLELAGHHARHVERVLYVYNLHASSIESHDRERQLACEQRIRALERYQPLTALD
jgi:glycosyltransferase involved in cell wall biosynthesis